jgi:hypothetical protein
MARPLVTSTPDQNIENSKLLTLKENIKDAVYEYNKDSRKVSQKSQRSFHLNVGSEFKKGRTFNEMAEFLGAPSLRRLADDRQRSSARDEFLHCLKRLK